MEVTPEMIKAVNSHLKEQEEKRRKEERDRRHARYMEQLHKLNEKLKTEAREIAPDLTDDQIDQLIGVFYDYMSATDNM